MSLYAQSTEVSVERTQASIKRETSRYGADSFMLGEEGARALVRFRINGRSVQFTLELPSKAEERFWKTPGGRRKRDEAGAWKAWEQACRQKWRALHLYVKALLEATHDEIIPFDEAFLPFLVLSDETTVGQRMAPAIAKAIENGTMPRLGLPMPGGKPHD